jgi:hypothetical protein
MRIAKHSGGEWLIALNDGHSAGIDRCCTIDLRAYASGSLAKAMYLPTPATVGGIPTSITAS